MIPTSTNVTVDVRAKLPARVDAVAVLINNQTKAGRLRLDGLNAGLRGAVERVVASGINKGKSNEVSTHLLDGDAARVAKRLIVIGHGDPAKLSAQCLREASAVLCKQARKQGLGEVALVVPELPDTLPGMPNTQTNRAAIPTAIEALTLGFYVGGFAFDEYKGTASKTTEDAPPRRVRLTLVHADQGKAARESLARGQVIGEAQNFARTIAFRPGNDINPLSLVKVAQQLGREVGLRVRVINEQEMGRLGMGGILAVGRGSRATPPRMIVLEHGKKPTAAKGAAASRKSGATPQTLLVVGKSITFDTGGISIKPAANMQRMIFDKCGGMAVLGLMYAVAKLKLPVHVVGILAAAENHVSGDAYRPGDILRMYNGVTVEITNTDAEGRLVLGDAIAWGCETYKPAAVLDLATLTGGVVVALGKSIAGVMGNNDALMSDLQHAADTAGEKIWHLPIEEEMKDWLKSDFADIVNSGGREGHPLQGGVFLNHFVPDNTPWAHLDIAGTADTEKELPMYTKGATGWGVRTLVEWVRARAV